ncbi:MAG: phosphate ABC transporter substrate-binding protein PstS [Anaerolineae bacterium]
MQKRILWFIALLALVLPLSVMAQDEVPGSGLVTGPLEGEATDLTGAGATFPAVLYTAWFSDYATLTGVQVNYQAIGSGGGIKAITDQTADFGASDGPMTDDQLAAAQATCGADILHIATALGGVVVTYNIPELQDSGEVLKFTPDTLAGIFLGEITNWKDEKLVADNPQLAEIDQPIAVVHRSDGSGTTNIFTSYLKSVSETWATNVGSGTSVKWPTGIGQKGNAGIAGAIAGVPYALGYVELAYAEQNGLPESLIQNSAGNFVGATLETVTNAASGVEIPEDERVMIVNGAGDDTYPISGFTWLLVCPNQTDAAKATAITRMLWWATHDGQSYHADLGYSPLPEAAIAADEAQIMKITVNGAPALPADIASGMGM